MSCDIKYEKIIFSIQKISRFNNTVNYVFIGITEDPITSILNKLENRENILKDEVILLKKKYPNDFNNWIKLIKNKIKIKFLPVKIHMDDSINQIREKIYIYISDIENKSYIIPQNQELWLKKNNGENEIIGYYYENKKNKEKETLIPHIFDVPKIEKSNIIIFDTIDLKKNTSENNMLIIDLLENSDFIKNIIYLSDIKEEEKYFLNKKIKIDEYIINNYFKRYWPYYNLKYDMEEIKNNYLLMKEYYLKENYIFDLINNFDIYSNTNFGSCNILTIKIVINNKSSIDFNTLYNNSLIKNDSEKKYVDLFPIFDYIREFIINDKTPFLKYFEDTLEAPFSIISKEAIYNNKINKNYLEQWLGIKSVPRRMNGIIIKRYLKDYNDEPRYSSISLDKHGSIQLNVSFNSECNANFNDIKYAIDNCNDFIYDINKNRIPKKDEKDKIEGPELKIIDNEIIFKKNTKLIYMNITIPIKLDISLDFKKLEKFSKNFPSFLEKVPKNLIKKELITENSINLKYKRISGFANMNDILLEIDILKQKYDENNIIIKILEKKYQKSVEEIKGYLIEWERKYSSSKTSKISSQFRTGILVTISNNNIFIHGITKLHQIPMLYNFFKLFLTLFINYEKLIKNDQYKNFKKYFLNKNIESYINIHKNNYEIDNDVKLKIDDIYNYDFDDNILIDDYFDQEIDEENKYILEKNNKSENKIIGISTLDDVGKDVKLQCEDAIPEIATCKDFCNDARYFLRRLQIYDNKLFKFETQKNSNKETYGRKCQIAIKQPIVLPYDPETEPKIKRNSYTYSVKYSSDPNVFQRWYMCPKIWCPYCELPISEEDIDKKTIQIRSTKDKGGKCKTAICPFGSHQVFIREKGNEKFEYPGFLDSAKHPKGFCLPCCFKLKHNDPKSSKYKDFKKCIGDEINNEIIKDTQIYILGKGIPIENNRYGKLNFNIARILKTNLDTGYLGYKSGYLRKGIKHDKNNSFLSCICEILSCDKINSKIDLKKIKKILVEKINENLFKSLHSGNLQNVFHNPKQSFTPLENFKNYILNENIDINHKYLWDYLQRENIIFEKGINIFIFDSNKLLCPIGEDINNFYNIEKNSILLIKSKDYYEPIYYLSGDGKSAISQCIFKNNKEEINKLFEIAFDGCKNTNIIDWISVLKDNIKKYDINIDNLIIDNGENLEYVLRNIITNVYEKKLDKSFLPVLQYVDSYNKVFGLELENGLYLPINPSKLIEKLKYKIIVDMNDINKIEYKNIIKYTNELNKKINLKCKITHKILDIKNKKYIIALVNEYNRFIPIRKTINEDNILKVSNLNYYSDVDESLENKIKKNDKRVEQINKKNYEDESYIRIKFELSKYLQIKENKKYLKQIHEIIYSDHKNIIINRKKLFDILDSILSKLVIIQKKEINLYDYKIPNKRIPCYIRSVSKKNKDIKLSCNDDYHCTINNNSCKLQISEKNLLDIHKKFNNYNYYISKIVDELLRYNLKRDEILNDNIPNIINKELIEEIPNKYIIIHTSNITEINNIIDKLFLDNKGLFIDNRNLYEEIYTKEIGFKKEKYIKTNSIIFKNDKIEELSFHWNKFLTSKFKVILNDNNRIFQIVVSLLNLNELKNNENIDFNIDILKNQLIEFFKNIILKKYKNIKYNVTDIIDKYINKDKLFKYIDSIENLYELILNDTYEGNEIDLEFISKLYKINFIILDKRIKKNHKIGYESIITNNDYYYVLLYKSIIFDTDVYNLIQSNNKIIFKINQLPDKFVEYLKLDN